MLDSSKTNKQPKSIFSAVLADESIVETILNPNGGATSFLHRRSTATQECKSLDLPRLGRVVPYSASNNLITHGVVLLASDASPYSSENALVASVRDFIHRYCDVSEGFEEVASYYVLLTWVYDAFNEVPYLRLKGDFGSGKSRCLLTIGSLCYKPMFASGASTVSPLFRIMDACRGTLVVDESDFRYSDEKSEIIKILNNGNAVGFPVLRSESNPQKEFNPTAFNVFGPKIIATRASFDDRALESRCITETMSGAPPRPDIPLTLPKNFHNEARDLRNQLLMYRFQKRNKIQQVSLPLGAKIEARTAQIFAPLLSIVPTEEARTRLIRAARGESDVLRAERTASTEAQLLDIIYTMRRERVAPSMKNIAERFAEQFSDDYQHPITPRWIGGQLRKRLSLVPIKSHGTFQLSPTEETKLETLFIRYGITAVNEDKEH